MPMPVAETETSKMIRSNQNELLKLMPMLEDVLTTNPRNRRFIRYLKECADEAALMAYTFARCGDAEDADNPEFWRKLALDDQFDITQVLYFWQLHAIYQHWYR